MLLLGTLAGAQSIGEEYTNKQWTTYVITVPQTHMKILDSILVTLHFSYTAINQTYHKYTLEFAQ